MIRLFFILITVGLLSACTSHQLWSTAQVIKNLDCDDRNTEIYNRCNTNLEEENELALERKRQQEEESQRERDIQEALARKAPEEKNPRATKNKLQRVGRVVTRVQPRNWLTVL